MTLTQLGNKVDIPASPDEAVIETVEDHNEEWYVARFICPEFTSLCPVTGQPDYAELIIDYIPSKGLIESKSLKLFLGSFRNHKGFHEATTMLIGRRLCDACDPIYIRIAAYWRARGGIAIDVFWEEGHIPSTPLNPITLPDNSYKVLRSRS